MAEFTPLTMEKDGRGRHVTTWQGYFDALWEGWSVVGEAPVRSPFSDEQRADLSATFATKGQALRPQSVVPFGDSIVAHGETTVSMDGGSHLNYTCRGWWNYANQLLGARFTILDPSGVVGDTLAQMLTRVQVDVLDRAPGWVWMDGGINDVRNGRTYAAIVADLDNLFGQFADAGIRVLMTTLVPDTSLTSAQHAIRDDVNHWLSMYAEANPNVILADAAAPLRDPAAAGASSTLTYDGLHPVANGHMRMAQVVADALAPHSSPRPPVLTGADSRNLLGATGMLNGNAGTGIATGWNKVFGGTDSAYSKVPRTDGIPGEWQQIVTPNGANWAMIFPSIDPTCVPGTVYECSVEWEAEGYDPAPTGVMSLQLQMLFLDSVDGIVGGFNSNYIVFGDKMTYLPGGAASGIAVTPRIAAPALATQVRLAIRCEGGGTRRLARATIRKIT